MNATLWRPRSAARGSTSDSARTQARTAPPSLDSAVLLLPVLEFEPADSPRVAGTIDAIRERLTAGGPLMHRYEPGTDGLEGGEGAFLPCSFWLVQALARTGRVEEATGVFEELAGLANPLGLYAEEIDPATRATPGQLPASADPRLARSSSSDARPAVRRAGVRSRRLTYDAIVVGAGVSGLYQLHRAARARPVGARVRSWR